MSLNIASKGSQHRIPNDSSNESILLVRIFRPENTHACISNLLINNDQHLQSYCTSGQLKSIPIHLMEFYKQLPWRITCPWHITCKGITGPGTGCSGRYVKDHQNWVNTHEQPHVLPPPINTLDRIETGTESSDESGDRNRCVQTIHSVDLIHHMYFTNQNTESQIASARRKPLCHLYGSNPPPQRNSLRCCSESNTKQEGSDTTERNEVGYASNKSKFLPRSSQEPLQVINHGARITSRRAVQRKTVDVAHRCRGSEERRVGKEC